MLLTLTSAVNTGAAIGCGRAGPSMERSIRIGLRSPADSPFSQDPVHFRPAQRAARGGRGPRRGERSDPVRAPRPPTSSTPAISQAGRRLIALGARPRSPVPLARLDRLPLTRAAESRYLCFTAARRSTAAAPGSSASAAGGDAHTRVGVALLNAQGQDGRRRFSIAARVKRPSSLKLVLALAPGRAGLAAPSLPLARRREPRRVPAAARRACRRPGTRLFRLRPVRVVGCTGGGAGLVTNGPRDRDAVALTFDDGPSAYTDAFLDVLRDEHARRDLLRDRPGDRRPRGDDAAHPPRRQRDRQPHHPPSGLSRLRRHRRRPAP